MNETRLVRKLALFLTPAVITLVCLSAGTAEARGCKLIQPPIEGPGKVVSGCDGSNGISLAVDTRGSRPRIPNCGYSGYGFKPVRTSFWDPGCTGGSPKFYSLSGSRWGRVAKGHGRVSIRVCDPDCVNGYQVSYKAKLRASRVGWCHGTRMYRHVVSWIRYRSGDPNGHKPGWERWAFRISCST